MKDDCDIDSEYRHQIDLLRIELNTVKTKLHEVREIYAGMEGFIPETAPEGYCLRIIRQMYDAAK